MRNKKILIGLVLGMFLLIGITGFVSAVTYVSTDDVYTGFNWDDYKNYSTSWSEYSGNLFYTAGNVGIGTTTPNESLVVNGNIWADNFYVTSDRDEKTNIVLLENSSFGNLYSYTLNKTRPIFEEQNLSKQVEVCEEVNTSKIKELFGANETSIECNNKTEYYLESVNIGTEYYDSEPYVGLMTDELNETFIKSDGGTERINLYGLISKMWILLGGHDDRIETLEIENNALQAENTLIKSALCAKDNTYSWCVPWED